MAGVTVVIPTRNRPKLLSAAVASALGQSLSDVDVIVVDDASDPPAAVPEHERVRLIRLDRHSGPGSARNAGLDLTFGPLVLFCDDDDVIAPHALTTLREALEANPRAVAAIGARQRTVAGSMQRMFHPASSMAMNVLYELLAGWSAVPGQVMFRTSALQAVGGWRLRSPIEDRELLLRLAAQHEFTFVPEVVLTYGNDPARWQTDTVEALRMRVFAEAIHRAPPAARPAGWRARRAGALIRAAERTAEQGRALSTLARLTAAVLQAPRLAMSPLIRPRVAYYALQATRCRRWGISADASEGCAGVT